MYTAKSALVAGVLFASVLSLHAQPASQQVIPFKVAAKVGSAMALLVAPSPTDEQLTALLNAFRAARMKGTLAQLIPATTPNAKVGGPYNFVTVFVISDPAAGNNPMLNMFVNPKTSKPSDNEKEWGKRILAYYDYSPIQPKGSEEQGTLGYKDEGYLYTSRHRKVF
jgi:hypothetical protein